MSRVQLALNVSNIDAAVDFYAKLFGTQPTKRHPGYANFAITEPPLKLVLMENPDAAGTLNHLGVEVESMQQVTQASDRFKQAELNVTAPEQTTCCYALQNKVWIQDPDDMNWEVYVVLENSDTFGAFQTETSQVCCS